MILYSKGCEFLNIPTSDNTAGALDVSFDDGETWTVLEKVSATGARVRIAGPDAEDNPSGTVVLQLGVYRVFVRYKTADETVIRRLGDHLRVVVIPT